MTEPVKLSQIESDKIGREWEDGPEDLRDNTGTRLPYQRHPEIAEQDLSPENMPAYFRKLMDVQVGNIVLAMKNKRLPGTSGLTLQKLYPFDFCTTTGQVIKKARQSVGKPYSGPQLECQKDRVLDGNRGKKSFKIPEDPKECLDQPRTFLSRGKIMVNDPELTLEIKQNLYVLKSNANQKKRPRDSTTNSVDLDTTKIGNSSPVEKKARTDTPDPDETSSSSDDEALFFSFKPKDHSKQTQDGKVVLDKANSQESALEAALEKSSFLRKELEAKENENAGLQSEIQKIQGEKTGLETKLACQEKIFRNTVDMLTIKLTGKPPTTDPRKRPLNRLGGNLSHQTTISDVPREQSITSDEGDLSNETLVKRTEEKMKELESSLKKSEERVDEADKEVLQIRHENCELKGELSDCERKLVEMTKRHDSLKTYVMSIEATRKVLDYARKVMDKELLTGALRSDLALVHDVLQPSGESKKAMSHRAKDMLGRLTEACIKSMNSGDQPDRGSEESVNQQYSSQDEGEIPHDG